MGAASDAEALKFIDSLNDQRRHLSAEQRAFAAAQLANLKHGGDRKNIKIADESLIISETATLREAAARLNVSHGSAARARAVLTYGAESDKNDVVDGKVSLSRKAESLIKRQPRKPKVTKPPKRDKRGRPSKNEPKPGVPPKEATLSKPMQKFATIEEHRRWVDPEFTGTATEWTDKYGHVQVMTAREYATDRFGAWAINMRFLAKTAKGTDWPNVDHNWLRSPKPADIAKMEEALEALRPRIVEAEALLARAREAGDKTEERAA